MANLMRPTGALLLLGIVLASVAGCGRGAQHPPKPDLDRSLAALADAGQLEALQLLADLEVLRAQGVFADSTADRLAAGPARTFLAIEGDARVVRTARGHAFTTLLAHPDGNEARLATVRRLAAQDPAAAAAWVDSVARRDTTRIP